MKIVFTAEKVEFNSALGGDIEEVIFDEDETEEIERTKHYLLVQSNYEFSGGPTLEWFDGHNYDGDQSSNYRKVKSYSLTPGKLEMTLFENIQFEILFDCDPKVFEKIEKYFAHVFKTAKKV